VKTKFLGLISILANEYNLNPMSDSTFGSVILFCEKNTVWLNLSCLEPVNYLLKAKLKIKLGTFKNRKRAASIFYV
jgi:hypothetical protein